MLTYIAVGFILFLAGFIQGFSGFGAILMSLPLLFLGTHIGGRFFGRINETRYRRSMMVLLAGPGVLIIVRA